MRNLDWMTAQQREAVERTSGLVCVEAGAGAGKTSVIAERYLRLVYAENVPPSEILTITFTRKAAQEMKRRIIGGLAGTGMEPMRREVENGYIHTIHGFCERLLRENPFDAGVDPSFPMLEEGEALRFRERAFEMATGDALRGGGVAAELVATGSVLSDSFGSAPEMLGSLRIQVDNLLDQLRNFGFSPDELEEWASQEESEVAVANERALRLLAKGIVADLEPFLLDNPDPKLSDAWRRIALAQINQVRAWKDAVNDALQEITQTVVSTLVFDARKDAPKLKQIAKRCQSLLANADDPREKEAAERSACLLRLALLTWRHYEALKATEGQLDFSDLEGRTVSLLNECEPIRNRYQKRFQHILIDEFQDVNPLQAKLVKLLSSGENVCFVGDPRQAIYGFRFGDVAQFLDWSAEARRVAIDAPESAGHIPLDTNFRSRPGILRFVAAAMERAKRAEFGELTASRDAHESSPVEIWVGQEDRPYLDARTVAMGLRAMIDDPAVLVEDGGKVRRARWGDFAILFRVSTAVETYRRALFEAGIPNQVVGTGRNFYARYEVRDLRNVLQALVRPADDLALASLLRSPMVGLSMDALTMLSMAPAAESPHPDPPLAGDGFGASEGKRITPNPSRLQGEANVAGDASADLEGDASSSPQRNVESQVGGENDDTPTPHPSPLQGEGNLVQIGPDGVGPSKSESEKERRLIDSIKLDLPMPADDADKLSHFRDWFLPLSRFVDRRTVGEVIEAVLQATDYAAKLLCRDDGAQQLANVRKLLQIAIDSGGLTIAQFVRRLDRLEKIYQREGDAPTHDESSDVVKLMTAHGTKGLEFPIVILAHTFSARRPRSDMYVTDPKQRRIGSRIDDFKSIPYEMILEKKKDEEGDEEWRLLYVAMTRARDYLVVTLPGRVTNSLTRESWAGGLREALGIRTPTIPPGIRELAEGVTYRVRDVTE